MSLCCLWQWSRRLAVAGSVMLCEEPLGNMFSGAVTCSPTLCSRAIMAPSLPLLTWEKEPHTPFPAHSQSALAFF